jgi:hypothetical protein
MRRGWETNKRGFGQSHQLFLALPKRDTRILHQDHLVVITLEPAIIDAEFSGSCRMQQKQQSLQYTDSSSHCFRM